MRDGEALCVLSALSFLGDKKDLSDFILLIEGRGLIVDV